MVTPMPRYTDPDYYVFWLDCGHGSFDVGWPVPAGRRVACRVCPRTWWRRRWPVRTVTRMEPRWFPNQ